MIVDASYGNYDSTLAGSLPEFERMFVADPILLPVPAAGRGADIVHIARSGRERPHIDDALGGLLHNLVDDYRACLRGEAAADARHLNAWHCTFGRARVALQGPVAL